jgi:ribosomal protein L37E
MLEDLNIPPGADARDELRARFRIVCRRCGSEDIAFDIEAGRAYSELTGADSGTVSIGCNGCGENDFVVGAL